MLTLCKLPGKNVEIPYHRLKTERAEGLPWDQQLIVDSLLVLWFWLLLLSLKRKNRKTSFKNILGFSKFTISEKLLHAHVTIKNPPPKQCFSGREWERRERRGNDSHKPLLSHLCTCFANLTEQVEQITTSATSLSRLELRFSPIMSIPSRLNKMAWKLCISQRAGVFEQRRNRAG